MVPISKLVVRKSTKPTLLNVTKAFGLNGIGEHIPRGLPREMFSLFVFLGGIK
jgi:hypothetical protein